MSIGTGFESRNPAPGQVTKMAPLSRICFRDSTVMMDGTSRTLPEITLLLVCGLALWLVRELDMLFIDETKFITKKL